MSIDNDAGAAPLVHLASIPDAMAVNGQYFDRLKRNAATSTQASDPKLSGELWAATESLLDLPAPEH